LFDKKKLIIAGLAVFTVGSALSGAATSPVFLICSRAVQGIGLGSIMALTQAIIGSVIPPRERGRYMAYTGAVMAVATVAGPLIGGFIVDASWLGWRWCFWSAVPFSILAMIVLNWRLRVPHLRREGARVDWAGAALITSAACALLIWISFVTKDYNYLSWQTFALLGFVVLAGLGFIVVELHVHDPIIPMPIIRMRMTALAILASITVGVAMFGAAVFLSQYYQLGRGMTPTHSGLMTIPMMAGVLLSSLFIGRLVSKLGIWKPFVVIGAVLLTGGLYGLSYLSENTSLVRIGCVMVFAGLGVGMMMQNLVLAVQNSVSVRDVGSATGMVTFFRSLGGAVGIQTLGLVFQHRLTDAITSGTQDIMTKAVMADAASNPALAQTCGTAAKEVAGGNTAAAAQLAQCPDTAKLFHDMATLQATGGTSMDIHAFVYQPFASLLRNSIGDSIGHLFWLGAIISAISIIITLFMRSTHLRAKFNMAASADDRGQVAGAEDDADEDDADDESDTDDTAKPAVPTA
ncbi:MAG: MFS transporter, partial [Propionibacteriaceae bacterium]|nr:MFS transporter [Propionibacteriaceae bacterium]